MKNFQHLICLAAFCFILTNARAQNQNDQAMKPWIDYMTPGDQQKMLAKSAGDWKGDVSTMMNPSQPPMKSQAAVHNEMIMGGRYLSVHYTGNMMGMPFDGMGTIAYDNGEKKYTQTWIDNMGTGIMYMEGWPAADGKSIEFKGKGYDPMQGKEVTMRQVMTFNSDNDQTLESYTDMNGKEMKTMTIHLTR